jgi:hypothetical protein
MPSLPFAGSGSASHWTRPGACDRIADVGAEEGGEVAQVPRVSADAVVERVAVGLTAAREAGPQAVRPRAWKAGCMKPGRPSRR